MTNKQKAEICREQALEALQEGNFKEYHEYMEYAKDLEKHPVIYYTNSKKLKDILKIE